MNDRPYIKTLINKHSCKFTTKYLYGVPLANLDADELRALVIDLFDKSEDLTRELPEAIFKAPRAVNLTPSQELALEICRWLGTMVAEPSLKDVFRMAKEMGLGKEVVIMFGEKLVEVMFNEQ